MSAWAIQFGTDADSFVLFPRAYSLMPLLMDDPHFGLCNPEGWCRISMETAVPTAKQQAVSSFARSAEKELVILRDGVEMGRLECCEVNGFDIPSMEAGRVIWTVWADHRASGRKRPDFMDAVREVCR